MYADLRQRGSVVDWRAVRYSLLHLQAHHARTTSLHTLSPSLSRSLSLSPPLPPSLPLSLSVSLPSLPPLCSLSLTVSHTHQRERLTMTLRVANTRHRASTSPCTVPALRRSSASNLLFFCRLSLARSRSSSLVRALSASRMRSLSSCSCELSCKRRVCSNARASSSWLSSWLAHLRLSRVSACSRMLFISSWTCVTRM